MWEVCSNGETPYKGILDVVEYLKQGKRLSKPKDCEDEMYELMLKCWKEDPKQRPKWPEIFKSISKTSAEELFASAEKLIPHRSKDEVKSLLEQVAELKYPPAFVALNELATADFYEDWFEQEIKQETNLSALAWYGVKYYIKGDTSKVHILKIAAEKGHCLAQSCLGFCYLLGIGLSQNSKRAAVW